MKEYCDWCYKEFAEQEHRAKHKGKLYHDTVVKNCLKMAQTLTNYPLPRVLK